MPDTRTKAQRCSDWVCEFCGSWTFIAVFAVFTFGWIIFNGVQLYWHPFDPYPFILLNLVFTVVELFQGPLILMSEHRQTERDREAIRGIHQKLDEIINSATKEKDRISRR